MIYVCLSIFQIMKENLVKKKMPEKKEKKRDKIDTKKVYLGP